MALLFDIAYISALVAYVFWPTEEMVAPPAVQPLPPPPLSLTASWQPGHLCTPWAGESFTPPQQLSERVPVACPLLGIKYCCLAVPSLRGVILLMNPIPVLQSDAVRLWNVHTEQLCGSAKPFYRATYAVNISVSGTDFTERRNVLLNFTAHAAVEAQFALQLLASLNPCVFTTTTTT
jgi:hypothetical protein